MPNGHVEMQFDMTESKCGVMRLLSGGAEPSFRQMFMGLFLGWLDVPNDIYMNIPTAVIQRLMVGRFFLGSALDGLGVV